MSIHKINDKQRTAILLTLLAITVLLIVFSRLRISALGKSLLCQQAAERFTGQSDEGFVQISIFFTQMDEVTDYNILLYNEALQSSLNYSGIKEPETGSIFTYAFSNSSDLAIQSTRGTFNISAIGTGGNFFFFHPYRLLYGSCIDIPAGNGVVLNAGSAWKLFGAINVVGMPVTINGAAYVVTGIVDLEADKSSRAALGGTDCIAFVPYSAIGTGITCYEVVLPEPVKGYGKALIDGLYPGDTVKSVNTSRFSASIIWDAILDLPAYNMITSSIQYPYWENAARNVEMRIILWTLFIFLWLKPILIILSLIIIIPSFMHISRYIKRRTGYRKQRKTIRY